MIVVRNPKSRLSRLRGLIGRKTIFTDTNSRSELIAAYLDARDLVPSRDWRRDVFVTALVQRVVGERHAK